MSESNRFIARIITRLNPEAIDAIIPHGPAWAAAVAGPFPDPWRQYETGPVTQPWIVGGHVAGPFPEPWRTPFAQRWDRLSAVALNPQPLPPREKFAISITDAMLSQVVVLANAADFLGADPERIKQRVFTLLHEWDELCPRWPKWPKNWPPPPDPPDWFGDEMSPVGHFLAATRVLAAADAVYDESVASSLAEIGNRQFDQALSRMSG